LVRSRFYDCWGAEFQANSGSVTQPMGGVLAHLDLVLLHHPGRCSGAAYITPLAYMAYENGYLYSYPGGP
jgi:hypothetical protein